MTKRIRAFTAHEIAVLEAGRGEIALPDDPERREEAIDRLARTPLRKRSDIGHNDR